MKNFGLHPIKKLRATIISVLASFFICIASTVTGQEYSQLFNSENKNNQCLIHVNKPFYTTGEIVWFKGYLPEILVYQNSLARIDVVSSTHNIIESHYLKISKTRNVSSYFRIPIDLKSDYYYLTLTVYKEDGNVPFVLVRHPLPIFNDLEDIPSGVKTSHPNQVRNSNDPLLEDIIPLITDKKEYATRETITFQLQTKGIAEASITVTEELNYPNATYSYGEEIKSSFLVDNEITHSGIIYNPETDLAYETDYLSALIVEEGKVKSFESYNDGRFELDLAYFVGKREIQLVDYFKPQVVVQLDTIDLFNKIRPTKTLVYTEEVLNYLTLSRKRKKISQLFGESVLEKIPRTPLPINQLTPDRALDFAKYESFKDLEYFFKQITTPLKIKSQKNGAFQVKMVNPERKPFYPGTPKFMVNGYFISNFNTILSIDIKKIKNVDLFYFQRNLKKQFDILGSNGIASIYTKSASDYKNDDIANNAFTSYGGKIAVSFDDIYAKADKESNQSPRLDPSVYWNHHLKSDENGLVQLKFRHGDTKGKYKIQIVGDYSAFATYIVK